jgi:hypothetical protein
MARRRRVAAALAGLLAATPAAAADENRDLDLIPDSAQQGPSAGNPSAAPSEAAPESTVGDARRRIYLENASTAWALRNGLAVPPPGQAPPNWQERLFLDARLESSLDDKLRVTYSGRLNAMAEDDISFPSHGNVRNDLREAFATWEPLPRDYLELGRINLKSGVASGFNPTDFFKTRAVVDRISQDPASLRENRLGSFMLLGQTIREGASLSVAFAPALYAPSPIYPNVLPSFDPMLDRTNAHDRLLVKGSASLPGDLDPELLLYREGARTRLGANLSRGVGQSTVLYAEWAGGDDASLIDDALAYGRQTGTLPANLPDPLPGGGRKGFQNDLALGGSYATENRITFNLEYHYHEAGFTGDDWRNWFALGTAHPGMLSTTGPLWYIRSYALDQQVPVARQSAFLRADWVDAFVPKLELTGFVDIDLYEPRPAHCRLLSVERLDGRRDRGRRSRRRAHRARQPAASRQRTPQAGPLFLSCASVLRAPEHSPDSP